MSLQQPLEFVDDQVDQTLVEIGEVRRIENGQIRQALFRLGRLGVGGAQRSAAPRATPSSHRSDRRLMSSWPSVVQLPWRSNVRFPAFFDQFECSHSVMDFDCQMMANIGAYEAASDHFTKR